MGCCRFLFCRLAPLLVVLFAVLAGFVASSEVPIGRVFWFVFQPFTLSDMYNGKMTPAVPTDMTPAARPANELFFPLPSGAQMPASGIGMCCRGTAYHHESVRLSTLWYLMQGGRLVDTAALYLNHEAIAEGVQGAIARGVPRKEIFLTTKIWPSQFGEQSATLWVDRMLKQLGVDYVDLVLLHAPVSPLGAIVGVDKSFQYHAECQTSATCWEQTWTALSAAKAAGKIRDIGISNFNIEQMDELRALPIVQANPIAVNQVPFNPWVPEWQGKVVAYAQRHGIALTGYSTLGGSLGKDNAATATTLKELADKHNVSVFLVLARWSLQRGVAVIPGTGNPKHMATNLNVFNFQLSDADMALLNAFDPAAPEAPSFFALAPPTDMSKYE